MSWTTVLLVAAVVWSVSLIRSVRWRAFVYSLPLPMTVALAGTGFPVDGTQVLGVVALNLFFLTVTVAYHRFKVPILLADLLGLAVYLGLSAALLQVAPLPFVPVLVGVLGLWSVVMLLLPRWAGPLPPAPQRHPLPALLRLPVILAGSTVAVLLGQQLRGMVVTFPYSGVLVAIESRRDLAEFSRHFVGNSLALVGFLAGYHWLESGPLPVALAGGWAGWAVTALLLRLPRMLRLPRRFHTGRGRGGADGSAPEPGGADGVSVPGPAPATGWQLPGAADR
ncbi:hypothetical protein [Micromonospora sp. NBC_01796]|uniref:hypothetical protein n=1 Tax=Micromonospora sp. NBC_01796 TaxID=2975987 RepID=UPI002DD873AF|nr:hypothetical protein [Micromonospora sp. NBC_01796]WSA83745.1 hypothetical protein OIE47_25625 [Micromonospora sp. NBC_01796]